MAKLIIPALQFKKFSDPFETLDPSLRGERPTKYRFYCKTADVPEELLNWMETNPRSQNLNTAVGKAICASLFEDNKSFHLWNRGILLSAESITFDNRSNLATIILTNPSVHGNIDGGHTLKAIIETRKSAEKKEITLPEQFVEFEVITGLSMPEDLAEARNNSVAVDTKSMEELKNTFDILKDIIRDDTIGKNHYLERIEFKQNELRGMGNTIDIREIISILNMFNQTLYDNKKPNFLSPIQSFSGKEVSLKRFIWMDLPENTPTEEVRAYRENIIRNMAPVIPDIFKLWDYIECNFTKATKTIGKRYGAKGYSNYEANKKLKEEGKTYRLPKSMFSNTPLLYTVPRGILYPLVGSFRALIDVQKDGTYKWIENPIDVWEELKETLTTYVMSASDECGNVPTAIGKSKNLWNSLFLTVSFYASTHR